MSSRVAPIYVGKFGKDTVIHCLAGFESPDNNFLIYKDGGIPSKIGFVESHQPAYSDFEKLINKGRNKLK